MKGKIKMKLKKILTCMVSTMCAAVMTLSLVSCGNAHTKKEVSTNSSSSSKADSSDEKLDDSKSFVIALYPEYAPETCDNFEKLVSSGFYDGLIFHRVMEGFMAQGGGYDTNGKRKESSNINGEFSANGFTKNKLSHTRGVVSMARATPMNSASSEFFICYSDEDTFLDGNYAAFGHVTDGMDVVDAIAESARPIDQNGTIPPEKQPVINSIKVVE